MHKVVGLCLEAMYETYGALSPGLASVQGDVPTEMDHIAVLMLFGWMEDQVPAGWKCFMLLCIFLICGHMFFCF